MSDIRLILVDDHKIVLDGIKALLDDVEGFDCVATAENGQKAIDLLKVFDVDVVLMDIDMPVMNGMEATRIIKKEFPNVKVISLTQHSERGMVKQLLDCGSDGYLLKNIAQDELADAIRKVKAGESAFSEEVSMSLAGKAVEKNANGVEVELTEREIEILSLISEGLSSKQIGEKLFISPRTVDTHRTNLMNKLDIHNIAGLIRFALKNGYA
ncbi:MAG: response regulator transcription factor [Flavobacteriales bacterium]|nr:response regulator transcription factor [Flavobacteriales bacterium]MCB9190177.1 response regulator transcription factor [Flavobacteriales bacterium]MCB9205399.1 response regulator transcription factor [Flavobacteriales bacterium]